MIRASQLLKPCRGWGNDIPSTLNLGDDTISPTPALATTYRHTGLTAGRTLYYRMRAVNSFNLSTL